MAQIHLIANGFVTAYSSRYSVHGDNCICIPYGGGNWRVINWNDGSLVWQGGANDKAGPMFHPVDGCVYHRAGHDLFKVDLSDPANPVNSLVIDFPIFSSSSWEFAQGSFATSAPDRAPFKINPESTARAGIMDVGTGQWWEQTFPYTFDATQISADGKGLILGSDALGHRYWRLDEASGVFTEIGQVTPDISHDAMCVLPGGASGLACTTSPWATGPYPWSPDRATMGIDVDAAPVTAWEQYILDEPGGSANITNPIPWNEGIHFSTWQPVGGGTASKVLISTHNNSMVPVARLIVYDLEAGTWDEVGSTSDLGLGFGLSNSNPVRYYGETQASFSVDGTRAIFTGKDVFDPSDYTVGTFGLYGIDFGATPPPPDTVPPVVTVQGPSGLLAAGTTDETLLADTDENATMRYDTVSGTPYDTKPNTFANTGGLNHSEPVSGLQDGQSYSYFVQAEDPPGNESVEQAISFSVDIADAVDVLRSEFTALQNQVTANQGAISVNANDTLANSIRLDVLEALNLDSRLSAVEASVAQLQTDVATAQAAADAAQSSADAAQVTADAAQTSADAAQTSADAAQADVNTHTHPVPGSNTGVKN